MNPESNFGNWVNFVPMVAGWILAVATFVVAVAIVALFTQKVMGWGGDHVDD